MVYTGLYNPDTQRQVTIVNGSSFTGLHSPDGQFYGVTNDGISAYKGLYHPCGALNVCITTDPYGSFYAPNGSLNIVASSNGYALLGGVSSLLPLHARIAFEGDSITAGSSGPQFSQFALTKSRGRFFAPSGWNQGTGGQTASQMSTQISQVLAVNPKVVVLLAGTNDLGGTVNTPAQIFADLRTCINGYKAGGARVVSVCVTPRNDATWLALGSQPQRETDRQTLNAMIAAQTDVKVVNVESTFDPTTMTVDGLHPNYRGAILLGEAVGTALNSLIVPGDVLANYLTSDNFLVGASANPSFTGTSGTKSGVPTPTGSVPTGWTVTHNDAFTVDCSITTLNGRTAQRILVSGTNGTTGHVVNFTKTVTYTGAAGDFWESWWDFSLASGAQNLRAISSSTDTAATANSSQTNIYPSDVAVTGVMRPPMTTALAGTDTSVSMQLTMTFAAGTVAADLTLAAPYYRKVPTGQ